MPTNQRIVGAIIGPNGESFDVVVDFDGDKPEHVTVMEAGQTLTSFWCDEPLHNCPLDHAAAIICGSGGSITTLELATVQANMDSVIDWFDTKNMVPGCPKPRLVQ